MPDQATASGMHRLDDELLGVIADFSQVLHNQMFFDIASLLRKR